MKAIPPALDALAVEAVDGSAYPAPFKPVVKGRLKRRLSPVLGLSNFGVNLTTLQPGAASALRHWHTAQDEFIYVISGTVTLVTDAGAQELGPGMCAGFPKGKADGHHLINNSRETTTFLEVGDRSWPDEGYYSEADLRALPGESVGKFTYTRKDGTPY
jgi:uncharacterized cupin superfamily protein